MSKFVDLPPGWCCSNLEEVARSIGGGTPSKSDPTFWTGGAIPWVSPKDMKTFNVTSSEDTLTEKALGRLSLIPADSVLVVVRSGILSRTLPVALNKLPVTVNQDMRAFVPAGGMSAKYLALQLIAREREVLSNCSKDGTTVASIEGPALAQFPLAIAPAVQQTRIVAKLEELLSDLDAGVAELKIAQKKLGQYRQSLLKAAVEGGLTADWREKQKAVHPDSEPVESIEGLSSAHGSTSSPRTDESETGAQLLQRILAERRARWEAKQLAKFKEQGKAPPKDWQKKYPEPVEPDTSGLPELPEGWVWASVDQLSPDDLANGRSVPSAEDGAKVLRLTAVRGGTIDLTAYKYGAWTDDEARPYAVTQGDLLIVRGNGSLALVGRAGLVPEINEQVAYPDTLIRLRVVQKLVMPSWLSAIWNSVRTRTHIESRARTSAGIYKISQPDITSVLVPVPPVDEQIEILRLLDSLIQKTASTESNVIYAFKQSTAQRQNILLAAFAGQLVPQDPNDEPASVLLERIRAERAGQVAVKRTRGRQTKGAA